MATGTIPVPALHIDESPTISVCINKEWASTLIGQIWGLRYPEAWGGTLEENRRARGEIKNLIDMLMSDEECGEMAICCEPQVYIYRINTTTGRPERSADGGTVWSPDPTDPVYTVIQQPAPVRDGVSTTKCDAATNFSQHFNDLITGCSENLGTATTIVQLAGGIAALLLDIFIIIVTGAAAIAIVTTITGLIFTGISAAFGAGKAAFDAYWTSDNKDKILCAALETMRDDGTWDQTGWDAFRSLIRVRLPAGAALDMVLTTANAAGYVGGNNMASYGASSEADCEGCNCICPCTVDWTFYGVTDVVKISDCKYTMKTVGGGAHVAFSSGDKTIGCYWGGLGLLTESVWPVGSNDPVGGINPATTPIWNMDIGWDTVGQDLVMEFSSCPI